MILHPADAPVATSVAFPRISVVVIGRNEGEALVRCMRAVLRMDYPQHQLECIYVDSASSDNSREVAATHGFRTLEVHHPRPTAARGRNTGWKVSTSDYILMLDGDTEILPDFVKKQIGLFLDPAVAAACGQLKERHPERTIFNRILELDWPSSVGDAEFCGGNALFRRSALELMGGFDESLTAGEEPDLCRRVRGAGFKIIQVSDVMALHDLDMDSWRAYWKRCVRSGFAYAQVSRRFWHTPDPFWRGRAIANLVQGFTYQLGPALAVLLSLALQSLWPVAACSAVILFALARTMWRSRQRTSDMILLFLYALHSHAAQIPIFWGQLRYYRSARSLRV